MRWPRSRARWTWWTWTMVSAFAERLARKGDSRVSDELREEVEFDLGQLRRLNGLPGAPSLTGLPDAAGPHRHAGPGRIPPLVLYRR